MKKIAAWFLIGVLALGLGAGVFLWHGYQRFLESPAESGEQSAVLWLKPGSSFAAMRAQVDPEAGFLRKLYWRVLALRSDAGALIQAGEYRLTAGITPPDLVQRLIDGDVIRHEFTIVEGWRFAELLDALRGHDVLVDDLEGLTGSAIMTRLGREGLHPEGRFLPETYHFVRGDSALDLLARALRGMDRALERVWRQRSMGLPLETPEEVLTLASIIEKETAVASEREMIAGVFIRRLKKNMRLQTDPTVIYGLGESFDGNLRRVDLRTDTPYNTYTRHGLPPTPIALPGLASLRAAINPAPGDALYFVSRGDGSHQFSATLEEHNEAVRRFQLK